MFDVVKLNVSTPLTVDRLMAPQPDTAIVSAPSPPTIVSAEVRAASAKENVSAPEPPVSLSLPAPATMVAPVVPVTVTLSLLPVATTVSTPLTVRSFAPAPPMVTLVVPAPVSVMVPTKSVPNLKLLAPSPEMPMVVRFASAVTVEIVMEAEPPRFSVAVLEPLTSISARVAALTLLLTVTVSSFSVVAAAVSATLWPFTPSRLTVKLSAAPLSAPVA